MHELTLVGVHEDGDHLVLVGPDGEQFQLMVDESLRAAVRRDRARLGQLQIQDGRLRPRDIQARIRAGQSAEEIAEAGGVPIEHVRRYEGPVLAEREFVARQARAVRIRRPGGSAGGSPTLGDLVTERLAAREVPEGDVVWDAWRGEDGAWIVALGFAAGSRDRQARWTYDATLRHVTALDDEARWFTEEPAATPVSTVLPPRRLVPIRAHEHLGRPEPTPTAAPWTDEPAWSGSDPLEGEWTEEPAATGLGAGEPPAPAASVDLLDSLRERRGRRQRPIVLEEDLDPFETAPFEPPSVDASLIDPALLDRTADPGVDPTRRSRSRAADGRRAHPSNHAGHQGSSSSRGSNGHPAPRSVTTVEDETSPPPTTRRGSSPRRESTGRLDPLPLPLSLPLVDVAAAEADAVKAEPAAPIPGGRRGKRASVPSWDDIVFGSRRE
jgi:uncharacterized protein (DUF433 family)